jgi:glutamyl-tRNA reductase
MKRLFVVGVSHKTAPVEWRERLALSEEASASLRARLSAEGVEESVLLSTCNRVELYAASEDSAPLRRALLSTRDDARLDACLYERADMDAVGHLFRVASGLDSLVVGESEILGQVKRAYESSAAAASTGKLTNVLFQRAIFVGKKVRAETSISEGPTSVPALASSLAERIFGDLRECRVLIVGAGAMAEGTLHALLSQKAGAVVVANRTRERAEALVRDIPRAETLPFDRLGDGLVSSDVVVCSTGAPDPVVTRAMAEEALRRRRRRPIFFIDIAVPRDVESSVGDLDGAYLYDIDDLESVVRDTAAKRGGRSTEAERFAAKHADGFKAWYESWRQGGTATLRHTQREG